MLRLSRRSILAGVSIAAAVRSAKANNRGIGLLLMGKGGSGAAHYVGPGDLVTAANWKAWFGLRAFSLAKTGTKCIRLVRASDSTQQDFNTLANGNLDVASIATFGAATTLKIVTIYDQTGNGFDLTQATDANRAAFNLAPIVGIGSTFPSNTFDGAASNYATANPLVLAQPFSWMALAQSPNSAETGVWGSNQSGSWLFFGTTGTPGFWFLDEVGGDQTENPNNALNFSSFIGVHNGASSSLNSNGYVANGSSVAALGGTFQIGKIFSDFFSGQIQEIGIFSEALTLSLQNSLIGNQQIYWGINQVYTSNQGAVVGDIIPASGGALPSHWAQFIQDTAGLTEEVVGTGTENGIPYVDLRVFGTYTGTNNNFFQISPTNSSNILAAPGQTWEAGFYVKLQAGSLSGIQANSPYIIINEEDGVTYLDTIATSVFVPTGAALNTQQYTVSGTTVNPSILSVETDFGFNYGPGNVTPNVIDVTFRIGYPTLVRTA